MAGSGYTQLISPAYNIPYVGGKCERFIENTTGQSGVWGAAVTPVPPYSYSGAWDSNYNGGNHPGELPPPGMRVPVYFRLGDNPEGHVALMLEDGRVASSTQTGNHATAYIHPNLQDLITIYAKYNGGCTYLGWSEYIGKEQVIKGEDMSSQYDTVPYGQDVQDHYSKRMFRDATEAEKANVSKRSWGQILDDNVTELGKRLQAASTAPTPGFEIAGDLFGETYYRKV